MDEFRFDGRVAIVTGAGSNPGLGRSYALLLSSRGAKVVVNDLGAGPDGRGQIGPGAEAVVDEIRSAGGEAVGDGHSVAERDGARAIVDTALDTWGRIDIVINNAGIAPFAAFDEITDRDIERVIGVHLMGHIWMCRAAWPHMAAQNYGRFVNVSSSAAWVGLPTQSIYAAGKLGVVGLTRSLAAEGAQHGIKANVISPYADTLALRTMLASANSEHNQASGQTPEVVAPVAAWLAHEGCTVTGKVLQAAGGAVSEAYLVHGAETEPNPQLLPLRILRDRDRGAASIAMFISAAGMSGVNLFLTYYLQQSLGYSPVETGLAFLPVVAAVMIASTLATSVLTPRFGPKPVVPIGMALAAAGLVRLTTLEIDSTCTTHVLPPLLVFGAGLGLVMAPSMSAATFGIDPADAGVGSASVNTMQQVGGSIGTALLSTLAASAATDYLAGKTPTPDVMAQSALESYSTAYWWSAAFFAVGAIVCGLLFRRGAPEHDPDAAPTVHM
ncbi:SDR family NAD(P)-dependent oxidoreductase [Streptomyces sp. NPDC007983]|uniref:SDR family NAD(P)-dependent oxidoreductase n=1 Tax=Streptomyces sp. NPDC007983 TaxID=3364800 RepID=UPI0036E16AC0